MMRSAAKMKVQWWRDISGGLSVMEEKAPNVEKSKKSARQGGGGADGSGGGADGSGGGADGSGGGADGSGGGADGSGGGGKKCWSPEEVEDISEASGMEEGELREDPGGAMVFGSPNDEQRAEARGETGARRRRRRRRRRDDLSG
ncbi:hypothetical protein KUCAC02_023474 [Chaenocephalus aceratus]|uniref:Uncharacterized protein n=1 Tax=Chaenocephalus aceratus TaxID=36190 RepID=A0ACB9XS57_CHAAC|nr:hypothetical protein KUCAC02_023474 [Chaenocephalus aceratus]